MLAGIGTIWRMQQDSLSLVGYGLRTLASYRNGHNELRCGHVEGCMTRSRLCGVRHCGLYPD